MKRMIATLLVLCTLLSLIGCAVNPAVLLEFRAGTLEKIEYDTMLCAQFKPDNIMKDHGFEFYIKFYFEDDKLFACDHVYKFKTEKEAKEWHEEYREALEATPGCYIDGTSVVKNEINPSLTGKSSEEIRTLLEYNFNYIGSELIGAGEN